MFTVQWRGDGSSWRIYNQAAAGAVSEHFYVEVATPTRFAALETEWRDLCRRTDDPNPFSDPAIVQAAAAESDRPVHVLLAWRKGSGENDTLQLWGVWALRDAGPELRCPIRRLAGPVHPHAALGNPVIARGASSDVLLHFLDTIARSSELPRVLDLKHFKIAPPIARALADARLRPGIRVALFRRRFRPELRLGGDPTTEALSRNRIKALRRRRKRLGEAGTPSMTLHDTPAGVATALEEFLQLEAAGWKGERSHRGQALLLNRDDAEFMRDALLGLAERGCASIAALRLDGRAIAMQIMLRSGSGAFTWKTAYDENLSHLAPGLLLLQEIAHLVQHDPAVMSIDSCNDAEGGYMAEFWPGRRETVNALIAVSRRGTLPFEAARFATGTVEFLRGLRTRVKGFTRSSSHQPAAKPASLPSLETSS